VENAVKHTARAGAIRVRLGKAGNRIFISVRDTGEGIAPEILPHVFEPFRRHGSASGLGIGLNVARHIVDLHGGRITVRSGGLGKGAEFVIALPGTSAAQGRRPARS
jgi:signal transduction histidine kinase